MRVGIVALQGDVREHGQALSRCGATPVLVRLPGDLDSVDALVIPGGESTTMSRLLRSFALEEPLRQRLADGLPCLATCAGLIVLSTAIVDGRSDQRGLGILDVAVRRNAYGRQVASFETDLAVPAVGPEPFRGVFIRAPRLEAVGAAIEVLAEHDGSPVAIAQGARIGLAFHPEMSGDDRLHRLFLDRASCRPVETAA